MEKDQITSFRWDSRRFWMMAKKNQAKKEEIKSTSETQSGDSSAGGKSAKPGGTKKDETIVTDYQHGRTVEKKVILPGEIKSSAWSPLRVINSSIVIPATAAIRHGVSPSWTM